MRSGLWSSPCSDYAPCRRESRRYQVQGFSQFLPMWLDKVGTVRAKEYDEAPSPSRRLFVRPMKFDERPHIEDASIIVWFVTLLPEPAEPP